MKHAIVNEEKIPFETVTNFDEVSYIFEKYICRMTCLREGGREGTYDVSGMFFNFLIKEQNFW